MMKFSTKAKSHLGKVDLGLGHSDLKLLMRLFRIMLLLKSSEEWNLRKSAKAVLYPSMVLGLSFLSLNKIQESSYERSSGLDRICLLFLAPRTKNGPSGSIDFSCGSSWGPRILSASSSEKPCFWSFPLAISRHEA